MQETIVLSRAERRLMVYGRRTPAGIRIARQAIGRKVAPAGQHQPAAR